MSDTVTAQTEIKKNQGLSVTGIEKQEIETEKIEIETMIETEETEVEEIGKKGTFIT